MEIPDGNHRVHGLTLRVSSCVLGEAPFLGSSRSEWRKRAGKTGTAFGERLADTTVPIKPMLEKDAMTLIAGPGMTQCHDQSIAAR